LGAHAVGFESVKQFFDAYRDEPGCAVVNLGREPCADINAPPELEARGWALPVIYVAECAATDAVVRAMKSGAITVLDKPCENSRLVDALHEALAADARRRCQRQRQIEFHERLASLSAKEEEVLRLILAGRANKEMAGQLGASLRTVENRRRSVFAKMGAKSVAELVALVLAGENGTGKDF
jgi:two-component system response regulator DctR